MKPRVDIKQNIQDNISDPEGLEKLYRENKRDFIRDFPGVAENNVSPLIRFWKIRLSYMDTAEYRFSFADLAGVLILSFITALLVKLPAVFNGIDETYFYLRYLAVIVFNGLILYTFLQNKINLKQVGIYGGMILALLIYVNLLPAGESDSLIIAFIHIPLLLWCLFGLAYTSFDTRDTDKRMEFIRFNGELLTMAGLLLITGGILTAITIGLFSAIGAEIQEQYIGFIVIPGSAVSPILASYLIKLYPDITRRIVPVLARVFTPIALATLIIYLVSLAFSWDRILKDRDLLIIFNVLLVAVMALIVFSVTELDKSKNRSIHVLFLLLLAMVTLVINSVALVAIISRLTDGLTPNRAVVIITNLLVFINLILITRGLYASYFNPAKITTVEKTVSNYLAVYFAWTIIAVFLFPVLFGFK